MVACVQGDSEKIGRILKQQKIKVAYKPQQTINSLFPRSKERDAGFLQPEIGHSLQNQLHLV